MISDVAPAFKLLIDLAAQTAPDVLEEILFNGDFDIVDGMLVEIEILGQVLVSLDESTSVVKLAELGQMIIGQTQVIKMCHEHWRRLAQPRRVSHNAAKENADTE
jgi:hypothetical protein